MLTVQYKGKGERTVGGLVVYPGELLSATSNLLAAWQAEHGDVFAVVGGTEAPPVEAPPAEAGAIVVQDEAAQVFDDVAAADSAAAKAKRK